MRILYHHRTLADGAEGIHIQEMIEAFQDLGHVVSVKALVEPEARGQGGGGFWGRVKAFLPHATFELAAMAYNLVDFVAFGRAIDREKPDLVYKRHAIYDIGAVLAARRRRVPVVLEINCPYSSPQHRRFERVRFPRLARFFEARAVDAATVAAVVSSPLGDYIRQLTRHPDRVLVVPNGANPRRFTPAPASASLEWHPRRHRGLVVGWAGILRDWHRVDLLIEAVARLPAATLLIVGDGPDRARLEQLAQSIGIIDRLTITGRVSHAEMPRYVAAFDVAVAADDRTGYASPMKILEYMAMAKAVVAPRLPNIEDLIDEGADGLLFEPGDALSLASILQRLASDEDLRVRLGRRARSKIEGERNWRRNAETVLDRVAAEATSSRDRTPEIRS